MTTEQTYADMYQSSQYALSVAKDTSQPLDVRRSIATSTIARHSKHVLAPILAAETAKLQVAVFHLLG